MPTAHRFPLSRTRQILEVLEVMPKEGRKLANVLVVEDNREVAELVAMTLRLDGHDVRTANDGAEGLLLAAERAPEVIVLDVGLPRLDGVELARALRQMHGQDLRLIAYTGNVDDALRDRLLEVGVDKTLRKPVPMPTLRIAVRDCLGQARDGGHCSNRASAA